MKLLELDAELLPEGMMPLNLEVEDGCITGFDC
jgi:hypothetical protein